MSTRDLNKAQPLPASQGNRSSLVAKLDEKHEDLATVSSSTLFDIVDKDGSGAISKDEFARMHELIEMRLRQDIERENAAIAAKNRAKRRTQMAVFALVVMSGFFLASVAANLGMVYAVVDNLVKVDPTPTDGRLVQKGSNSDVKVAQAGQEIMLGMLPYLPLFAPIETIESVPEYIVLRSGAGNDKKITAHQIVSAAYYEISGDVELNLSDGGRLELSGPVHGVHVQPNGARVDFCTACTPMQLKSFVHSAAVDQAMEAFKEAADSLKDTDASSICATAPQLASNIATSSAAVDPAPEVCFAGEVDKRRRLQYGATLCHPASSTLELVDGRRVSMAEVKAGDLIRTSKGFEPVVGLLHEEADTEAEYYIFKTQDATLAVSALHHIFVNGTETDPAKAAVGDILLTSSWGNQPIVSIGRKNESGIYHISTPSATYFVDDVLASTYVGIVPRFVYQFGDSYMEMRYRMGIPLVPEGKGLISIQWIVSLVVKLGVPFDSFVHRFVTGPLVMLAFVLVELINATMLYTSTAVAIPGAIAAAICMSPSKKLK